jgi:hypothetical protein
LEESLNGLAKFSWCNVMAFVIVFFCFLFFFVFGMLGGFMIGAEFATRFSDNNSNFFCERCDIEVPLSSLAAVFCEDCIDEESDDDRLISAIKEKELDIRYVNVALRQRNLVNKPDKAELENLRADCTRVIKLVDNVKSISDELDLKVNVEPLKERNESLQACINKWEEIADRDEKLDDILKGSEDPVFQLA